MGLFTETLEWFDETGEELVHRRTAEPSADIQAGAQLIVRERQEAIFLHGGQAHDRFGPGRYSLSSKNLPRITTALGLPWGFTEPFRCDVVFVSHRIFTDLEWSTLEPLVFEDPRLGLMAVHARGTLGVRVGDAAACVRELLGPRAKCTTQDAVERVRGALVSRLGEAMAQCVDSVFGLSTAVERIEHELALRVAPDLQRIGLELVEMTVAHVQLPPEVTVVLEARREETVGSRASAVAPRSTRGDRSSGNRTAVVESVQVEFCPSCGNRRRDADRFCSRCGRLFDEIVPVDAGLPGA